MSYDQDVNGELLSSVRFGNLAKVKRLVDANGVVYSRTWSAGYVLLRDALKYKNEAVAEFLLTRVSKVNNTSGNLTNSPLHFAVQNGYLDIVKKLLEKGAKIHAVNCDREIPLHYTDGNAEIAELLLKRGAYPNARNKYGTTLLQKSIYGNYIKLAELLLNHRADANAMEGDGSYPHHTAIQRGRLHIVKHLLKHGVNVNCLTPKKYSALHFAVKNIIEEVVTLLLNNGAIVDCKDEDNTTPLHIAAKKGYLHIAQGLLNNGACIYSKALGEEYTPLHFASEFGSKELIKLFLNTGADVNARTKDNVTALHIAAKKRYSDIIEDLKHGACINSKTLGEEFTPLHFATEWGRREIVELLLKTDADINASTKDNVTALHIAIRQYSEAIAKLLLQHGAEVDRQDKDGKTVLYLSVENRYVKFIENILRNRPDVCNQSNKSAFKLAVLGCQTSYQDIVETLREYGFSVEPEDANNPQLLYAAVEKGYLNIVEDLLKYGADVNNSHHSKCVKSFTLLHTAVKNKQEEVAKLLIGYKADINAKDENERSPIFYAIENADLKITKLLLWNKAIIKDDANLLITAVQLGQIEIAETLLQHNANVNDRDKNGRTALHFTVLSNNRSYIIKEKLIKLLLNKGADVDAQDGDGKTILHHAVFEGCRRQIEYFFGYDAFANIVEVGNVVPLQYEISALDIVFMEENDHVVRTLLRIGADINITDRYNQTPLTFAITSGIAFNTRILKYLKLHTIKMRAAKLFVEKQNLLSIIDSDKITFERNCEKELVKMKSEKINNTNISFYDVLVKDTTTLAVYMKSLDHVSKARDYKIKFPIYASMIANQFKKGVERRRLQNHKIFKFLENNFPKLPYECTEKIFSYLSNRDMKVLINLSDSCGIINSSSSDDVMKPQMSQI